MNITVTKEQLIQGITISERLTGKKESLPVLSCILLDAQEGFSLRATNLEAGVNVVVRSEIHERGTIAVPATIFSQTIRSIGGDKITLTSDEGNLVITARGTKTLIKAVPHDEFP